MKSVERPPDTSSVGRETSGAGPSRVFGWVLLAVLMMLGVGLAAKVDASAQMSAALFSYPFQFDESEGMILAETMLLDHGVNIYEKPGPDLFVAAPYPPLYYLLAWPVQHLIGPEPSFKIGRALSMGATLLAGVAIVSIIVSLTGDWLAALLGALMWWSLGLIAFWGSLVKPDMLALALGLCGLWWVLARPPSQVWWALPFFWAAFFTKQTAIAAGVAVTIWLLIRNRRTGIKFGAALGAGALLPALLLNLWTNGGYYYHMFTIHDLPWFPQHFADFSLGFLRTYGAFLVPGMLVSVGLAVWWLVARLRHAEPILPRDGGLLVFLYFCFALVEATGAGTRGGNHNHFLEWAAASCLGLGLGVALARRARHWQWKAAAAVLALVMLTQVPGLFSTPNWLGLQLRVPPQAYTDGMQNVFQYVTNNSGDAYSDNVGLMLLAHKRLWSTDPYTQTHATLYGRWDESALVQAIKEKKFSQIVFRIDINSPDAGAGDVSPGILQAVRDNYKLDQKNVENIYVPR